jgi:hypothetical protein
MFNGLFGIGRAYKKLPPHHNFAELGDNIEKLANELMDRSLGSFAREGYLQAPGRWQWQLGNDLRMLLGYARGSIPPDVDGLHHFSGQLPSGLAKHPWG